MKKVICCSVSELPEFLEQETHYFTLFSTSKREGVGHIGCRLIKDMRRWGITPSSKVWDFAVIALSVAAADRAILRRSSADGWTRRIELSIYLNHPEVWGSKCEDLETLLRFLTGDFWTLRFYKGGVDVPKAKRQEQVEADCVALLSGGVDSLVGAIDLTADGRQPLFVSHIVRGDRDIQNRIAFEVGGQDRHYQWSLSIKHPGESEKSTRARSMVFFALAALATSMIPASMENPVDIFVPENGFISLNIPLGPGRLGSLSTKTTHPVYMNAIQSIWDDLGINAKLRLPYANKTKGELLSECRDQDVLIGLVGSSTSCGRYQRHQLTHCGVCVPCLIRRAAFFGAGLTDITDRGYRFEQISTADSADVVATATAYIKYEVHGLQRFIGGNLSFASGEERTMHESVIERGLLELGQFLRNEGVL